MSSFFFLLAGWLLPINGRNIAIPPPPPKWLCVLCRDDTYVYSHVCWKPPAPFTHSLNQSVPTLLLPSTPLYMAPLRPSVAGPGWGLKRDAYSWSSPSLVDSNHCTHHKVHPHSPSTIRLSIGKRTGEASTRRTWWTSAVEKRGGDERSTVVFVFSSSGRLPGY